MCARSSLSDQLFASRLSLYDHDALGFFAEGREERRKPERTKTIKEYEQGNIINIRVKRDKI